MKKYICAFLSLVLTVLAAGGALPVAAAGATVSLSAPASVNVGDTVTLKVSYTAGTSIGSLDATLTYDAAVLTYSSAAGITANGNAGITKLSFFESSASPKKTLSFTLTFKAKAAGSCAFSLTTGELADWDTLADLGAPSGKATVSVKNPQRSGNADLASLSVSAGSLSPAFSAAVTDYNIVIPYSATTLLVSANAADKNAKVSVTGSQKMNVGSNTRAVTVTAQNGTVKTYTLHITRQENSGTATDPTASAAPNPDAATVTVGETTKRIAADLADITLPVGFEKTDITVNDTVYPALQNTTRAVTLLYLTDTDGSNGAFYIYNTVDMTFAEFCFAEVKNGIYVFLTPDTADALPQDAVQTFLQIGDKTVAAWSDGTQTDFYIVYALSPAGNMGFYRYDSVEGTLQRYVPPVAADGTPTATDAPAQEPQGSAWQTVRSFFSSLPARLGKTRLIALAVGIPLLLAAIVLLIVLIVKKPRNFKH